MRVLGIDTSSQAVSVAVGDVSEGFSSGASFQRVANNRHGELLAPLIEQVLAKTGAKPADFDAIAVGLGPGPFTGLRVGIMTAKTLGDALAVPVYGECSLDLIGPVANQGDDEYLPFACLSDARRKQVYWAEYDPEGNRVAGPELSAPVDLAEHLRGRVTVLAGAGAVMYRETFEGFRIADEPLYPAPSRLMTLIRARALAGAPSDDLTPLYLRRPDAQPLGKPKAVTPS